MIELDDEGCAVQTPATFAEGELCLKKHQPLEFRAEASRPGSIDGSFIKIQSSTAKSRIQSREVVKNSTDERTVRVGAESLAKLEDALEATPTVSGALQPEV